MTAREIKNVCAVDFANLAANAYDSFELAGWAGVIRRVADLAQLINKIYFTIFLRPLSLHGSAVEKVFERTCSQIRDFEVDFKRANTATYGIVFSW